MRSPAHASLRAATSSMPAFMSTASGLLGSGGSCYPAWRHARQLLLGSCRLRKFHGYLLKGGNNFANHLPSGLGALFRKDGPQVLAGYFDIIRKSLPLFRVNLSNIYSAIRALRPGRKAEYFYFFITLLPGRYREPQNRKQALNSY